MIDPTPIVFVVDDDPSVCRSLARLLHSAGFLVETFPSAQDFLRREPPESPSCLILDIRMPGLTGLDLQEKLAAAGYVMPIIFITGHGTVPMSVKAMKAGALDFLQKPFNDRELLDAIQKAVERGRQLREKRAEMRMIQQRLASLTPRESEVFALVVTGKLNKEIAYQLGVGEKTVKVHRARVMHKMQAESLADLVRFAERIGAPPEKSTPIGLKSNLTPPARIHHSIL